MRVIRLGPAVEALYVAVHQDSLRGSSDLLIGRSGRCRTSLRWILYATPGALNRTFKCSLSQNGLCSDWPQRHNVARGNTSTLPSSCVTEMAPLTNSGP